MANTLTVLNVKTDYGAVGDGSTDDTAAIQSAINAAKAVTGRQQIVYFPYGTYKITSTLVCANTGVAGQFTGVSLLGDGPLGTTLRWDGSTSGALLQIYNAKQYKVSGLRFLNNVAMGTTIGVDMTGSQSGTTTGSGVWEHCLWENFSVGARIGQWNNIECASELLFLHPMFYACGLGAVVFGYNTLDVSFHMLELAGCETGVKVHTANSVQVYGGSASGSTYADFWYLSSGNGAFVLNGFRSETANRFVVAQESGGLNVQGCNISALTSEDEVAIELIGGMKLCADGNSIGGKITTQNGNSAIHLRGNDILDTVPFRKSGGGDGTFGGVRFSVLGNRVLPSGLWFPDEIGYYNADDTKSVGMRDADRVS